MNNLDKTMAQNENNEDFAQENEAEETENHEQEHAETPDEQEDVNELKKKLATLEAQKDHWRKKAQTKEEKAEEMEEKSSNQDLTSRDFLSLAKADVHEDDIDDVVEYAQFKGISVSEALRNDVVKTILSNKAEYRKTAEAANTSNARKSSSKVSDDALLTNLKKGNVPDSKDEAERLFWARRGGKRG